MTEPKIQTVNTEVDQLTAEIEQLKLQIEAVTSERDQYKNACIQLSEQNANIWGLYNNTVDYILSSTQRKEVK